MVECSGTRRWSEADPVTVHEMLVRGARWRSAFDANELALFRRARELQLWRNHGYATMTEYLESELGYAPRTITERIRVAEALEALPELEHALAAHEVAFSAVKELTRVVSPEKQRAWLDHVKGKNLRQIEEAVQGLPFGADPGAPKSPKLRRQRLSYDDVLPETLALERQARLAANESAGSAGRLDDNAFLALVMRSFVRGSNATEEVPRPAYQISITTCRDCKRGWQNGAGREFPVAQSTLDRAACDAEHLGALDAESPERLTSSVTPRLRRQVFARDRYRCANPPCRSTRNLEIHHVEHQEHGGNHSLSNITLMCGACHALHHDGLLAVRGTAPDALEFIRAPRVSPSRPAAMPALPELETYVSDGDEEASYQRMLVAIAAAMKLPVPHASRSDMQNANSTTAAFETPGDAHVSQT
jgi:HNH endonuclease